MTLQFPIVLSKTCGLLFASALVLAGSHRAVADDRFTVCSITVNSQDEIDAFRKSLPESEFRFVELTGPSQTWFADACQSGVQCDVLVLSGHFGDTYAGNYGTTFAGERGVTLSLDELEARRCDSACPGVLGKPLEVFLFGCKTLAKSLDDRPLPPKDLALLVKYGVPSGTAERVVEEERYRGSDTSNERRMRFVFTGVPDLYGFSFMAPSGAHARPLLEEYLKNEGDYADHLRRLARERPKSAATGENRTLAEAFRPAFFAQSHGLDPKDAEYERGMRICGLRNDHDSVVARLEQIEKLIDDRGFVGYLPAIEAFLRDHPPPGYSPPELAALERVRGHARARDTLIALVNGLTTPLLRLEMVRVANRIGWVPDDQALRIKRDVVVRALQPPVYGEGRDVVCGIEPDLLRQIALRSGDLRPGIYTDEFGLQALACLKPADEQIQLALSRSLFDRREWIAREAAIALKAIRPALVDVQIALAQQLGRQEAGPRQWAAEALREAKVTDPRVIEVIKKTDPSFKIDWM